MALLDQIVRLEQRDVATASDDQFETSFMNASAMLAELQPTTATEALLEWQHRCSVEKTPLLPTVGGGNRDVRYSAIPPILVRLHRGGSEFPLA